MDEWADNKGCFKPVWSTSCTLYAFMLNPAFGLTYVTMMTDIAVTNQFVTINCVRCLTLLEPPRCSNALMRPRDGPPIERYFFSSSIVDYCILLSTLRSQQLVIHPTLCNLGICECLSNLLFLLDETHWALSPLMSCTTLDTSGGGLENR